MYQQASLALDDDFEDVRLAAIKLIWVFSLADPERYVKPDQNNLLFKLVVSLQAIMKF